MTASADSKYTILFVHGAWHTPAFFGLIIDELKQRGIEATCPLLPTCDPQRVAKDPNTSMEADSQAVEQELERLIIKENKLVLLTPHSYGGIVGSQAGREDLGVKQRSARGESGGIIGILYIATIPCPPGMALEDGNGGKPAPFVIVDEDGITTPQDPATLFYNDMEPATAQHWVSQLVPQPRKPHQAKVTNAAFLHHQTGYVLCEKDTAGAFYRDIMVQAVAQLGVPCLEYRIQAGHSPYLSMAKETADLLEEFAAAVRKE